jgi:hypothetical protein
MSNNEEKIRIAQRAKTILEDDLVQSALTEMENAVVDQWKELSIENKPQAEELKRLLWASQQFKRIFEVLVSGGTVAQNELLMETQMQIKQEAARERMKSYG